jgi:hypothetical protein
VPFKLKIVAKKILFFCLLGDIMVLSKKGYLTMGMFALVNKLQYFHYQIIALNSKHIVSLITILDFAKD